MKDHQPRFPPDTVHAMPKVTAKMAELAAAAPSMDAPTSEELLGAIASDVKRLADATEAVVAMWKAEIARTSR